MKPEVGLLLVCLFALTMCPCAWSQPASFERPSENIALGASYRLDPPPQYEHCTDPDDAKQLTDGVYTEGHFWTQKSTVGWTGARPAVITVDLGAVKPIRGISYNTAAGVAGVEWPNMIYILVADEANQFHEAGELVALSAQKGLPPSKGYATHRFWTDALQTHGRYVAIIVWGQPFIFADEVEVYAGDAQWLSRPLAGEPVSDFKAFSASLLIRTSVERRLTNDIAAMRAKASEDAVPTGARAAVVAEMDALTKALPELPTHCGEDFRAVLPLNDLHARLFRAQAGLWRAKGHAPFTLWTSRLWDPLLHTDEPPMKSKPALRIDMMRNEYRAGAFNISNATQKDAAFVLRIQGLPGGANPDYITVHEVAWTDTNKGLPVAAALPLAERKDDGYLIRVPSGLTRQVWLTFNPREIDAGIHRGKIKLDGEGVRLEAPLALRIYPLDFPEHPTLHFGGWDYTNRDAMYGMTPQNRSALIAHMKEHFVDSPWATPGTLSLGTYDAPGHMTEPPDTSNFDAWLQLWQGARQYCVFAAVTSRAGAFEMGTPEFDAAVKAWAEFWAGHIREKGLKPEQFAVLLVDEPRALEQDAVILAWAKAMRVADTGIRVWEDPIYNDMSKSNQETVAACDVLCPNRPMFLSANQDYRDYFVAQRERGATLDFYSCSGPVRLLDPYSYHRLQAWTCWEYGAKASYFWAFGDTGGASCWNEYATEGAAYTPLFLDASSVTAGKHLESCREGIEDYEYLSMLKRAVDDASARGAKGKSLDRARSLVAEAPQRVKASAKSLGFRWHNEEADRGVADGVRIEILKALTPLAGRK